MSGPLQTKAQNAIIASQQILEAASLNIAPDDAKTTLENLALIDAQLKVVTRQIQLAKGALEDIKAVLDQWDALNRKLGTAGEEENKAFADFKAKYKITDQTKVIYTKLAALEQLQVRLAAFVKQLEHKEATEARDAQLAHAQAMAAIAPAAPAAPAGGGAIAPAQQTLGTLYALPTLQIRPFRGDRRTWPEFWEGFRSAVHLKPGNQAEKLNLLRSLLEGEPKALISGFRLEDRNYPEAINLLKETYGDEKSYVRTLHAELTNLPRADNLTKTHSLLLELERITRELRTMGEDTEGPMVYLALEKKLNPGFLRTILIKKAEDPDNWDTSKFLETLNDAVRRETSIREVMDEYGHQHKGQSGKKPQQQQNPRRSGPGNKPTGREHTFANASVDAKQTSNKPAGTQARKPKGTTSAPAAQGDKDKPQQKRDRLKMKGIFGNDELSTNIASSLFHSSLVPIHWAN